MGKRYYTSSLKILVSEVEQRLSVVEELSALFTANLQRATGLRQSILQNALTSSRRVKGYSSKDETQHE